jgi:hypothetical protein
MTLPDSIAGYQAIVDGELVREDDLLVSHGEPIAFAGKLSVGLLVASVRRVSGYNVYRKIPVAKQGGDPEKWAEVERAIREQSAGELRPLPGTTFAPGITLPTDAKERKRIPIYSGFLKYFPRAVAAVAELSLIGNDQHNPGKPLHWDRSKSGDEADALMRHLMECDAVDKDGVPHAVKVAWRGMALAEKFLEKRANDTSK